MGDVDMIRAENTAALNKTIVQEEDMTELAKIIEEQQKIIEKLAAIKNKKLPNKIPDKSVATNKYNTRDKVVRIRHYDKVVGDLDRDDLEEAVVFLSEKLQELRATHAELKRDFYSSRVPPTNFCFICKGTGHTDEYKPSKCHACRPY